MGYFSWKTSDTKRSIANNASCRPTFPVIMLDDKGNQYVETDYEGYGVFGGKNYYDLLAEMNGKTDRDDAIDLFFENNESGDSDVALANGVKVPVLIENPSYKNQDWNLISPPEICEYQGYFYPNDNEY